MIDVRGLYTEFVYVSVRAYACHTSRFACVFYMTTNVTLRNLCLYVTGVCAFVCCVVIMDFNSK